MLPEPAACAAGFFRPAGELMKFGGIEMRPGRLISGGVFPR
jgi:hypothetical protein